MPASRNALGDGDSQITLELQPGILLGRPAGQFEVQRGCENALDLAAANLIPSLLALLTVKAVSCS